jgi:hypothetical protein
MEITVLYFEGCPNAERALARVRSVVEGRDDITVTTRAVEDEDDAVAVGMHGSPTVLIDGADPFASPGTAASYSCRVDGGPTVEQLRRVVAA